MNAQRWIALGLLALAVACVATNNLWLAPFRDRETSVAPAPADEAAAIETEAIEAAPQQDAATATIEPTLDPVIAELMAETGIQALGVGDQPFVTMAGDFIVIDSMHRAEGTVSIYQIGDVQRALRLDPFSVSGGPDLHVILSQHPAPRTSAETLLPIYVDLGQLKGFTGAQNYDIPDDIDLTKFKSVVIYSMSLNLVFSTATLEQVRG